MRKIFRNSQNPKSREGKTDRISRSPKVFGNQKGCRSDPQKKTSECGSKPEGNPKVGTKES